MIQPSRPARRQVRCFRGLLVLGLLVGLTGCFAARPPDEVPPDEQFGHRFDGQGPEGRQTIAVTPADSGNVYFYYPALFDTVHVRPAPFDETTSPTNPQTPVELLIKGSFPDACSMLHEVSQERAGNIVSVVLAMRKPRGEVCAAVRRPYRFYLMLDGQYGPGSYTLKLNDFPVTFEIRRPEEETR